MATMAALVMGAALAAATGSPEPETCNRDTKPCMTDGTSVGRNPDNHCEFFNCPKLYCKNRGTDGTCTPPNPWCTVDEFADGSCCYDCTIKPTLDSITFAAPGKCRAARHPDDGWSSEYKLVLTQVGRSSAEECAKKCVGDPGCSGFSWYGRAPRRAAGVQTNVPQQALCGLARAPAPGVFTGGLGPAISFAAPAHGNGHTALGHFFTLPWSSLAVPVLNSGKQTMTCYAKCDAKCVEAAAEIPWPVRCGWPACSGCQQCECPAKPTFAARRGDHPVIAEIEWCNTHPTCCPDRCMSTDVPGRSMFDSPTPGGCVNAIDARAPAPEQALVVHAKCQSECEGACAERKGCTGYEWSTPGPTPVCVGRVVQGTSIPCSCGKGCYTCGFIDGAAGPCTQCKNAKYLRNGECLTESECRSATVAAGDNNQPEGTGNFGRRCEDSGSAHPPAAPKPLCSLFSGVLVNSSGELPRGFGPNPSAASLLARTMNSSCHIRRCAVPEADQERTVSLTLPLDFEAGNLEVLEEAIRAEITTLDSGKLTVSQLRKLSNGLEFCFESGSIVVIITAKTPADAAVIELHADGILEKSIMDIYCSDRRVVDTSCPCSDWTASFERLGDGGCRVARASDGGLEAIAPIASLAVQCQQDCEAECMRRIAANEACFGYEWKARTGANEPNCLIQGPSLVIGTSGDLGSDAKACFVPSGGGDKAYQILYRMCMPCSVFDALEAGNYTGCDEPVKWSLAPDYEYKFGNSNSTGRSRRAFSNLQQSGGVGSNGLGKVLGKQTQRSNKRQTIRVDGRRKKKKQGNGRSRGRRSSSGNAMADESAELKLVVPGGGELLVGIDDLLDGCPEYDSDGEEGQCRLLFEIVYSQDRVSADEVHQYERDIRDKFRNTVFNLHDLNSMCPNQEVKTVDNHAFVAAVQGSAACPVSEQNAADGCSLPPPTAINRTSKIQDWVNELRKLGVNGEDREPI